RALPRDRRRPGHRIGPCRARALLGRTARPKPIHRVASEQAHRHPALPPGGRSSGARRALPHGDRRPAPAVRLLGLALSLLLIAQPASASPNSERAAILRVVERMEGAWNRGDFKGYMAC